MKVTISITRRTRYSSIVEMDEETFKRLDTALDSSNWTERRKAEKELDELIDPEDWQGDDFDSLDDFYEYEEARKV